MLRPVSAAIFANWHVEQQPVTINALCAVLTALAQQQGSQHVTLDILTMSRRRRAW
jgi:hypothetical protein